MDSTVIVVDDEVNTVRLVKRVLEREGFRVLTAGSGDEAVGIIEHEDADVMLLDIMMPGLPPKKVIEMLREKRGKIRIFYFSALKEHDEASKRIRDELVSPDEHDYIVGYIEKPFDNQELIERIRKVLE
jgi:DNA-binding response OmpR family regulator